MSDASISFDGLEELQDELKKLAKKYPDCAGELLKTTARQLRKDVVKNVKKDTSPDTKNKKSLAKVGSYKISQVKGFGVNQYVEISAKSPHFHLVEHGHEIVIPYTHGIQGEKGVRVPNKKAGQKVGFVEGKHMMENARKKAEREMPKTLEKMIDTLLKEGGF